VHACETDSSNSEHALVSDSRAMQDRATVVAFNDDTADERSL